MTGYAYTPWIWPLVASAVFNAALSVYLWRRRQMPGALPLSLAILVIALWCAADAGEITATQFASKQFWFLVRDALALPGVTLSLWFVIHYAGLERWLTRPIVALLAGALIALTPLYLVAGGSLLWGRLWLDGSVRGELAPLGAAFGVYGFGISLLATAILLLLFIRSPAHRVPVALIMLGQIGVRVAYPLGALNIANVPNLATMDLAVDFASLMYVIALFRFRLFDLVPVARETILERIPDAMLVLDSLDRVADLNAAATRLLELPRNRVLGQPVASTLAAFPDLARCVWRSPADAAGEVSFETATGTRSFEVSSTPLVDWHGAPIGRLVLLHDTTALRRVEAQLMEQERALAAAQERERVARELHDGLAQDLWLAKLKTGRLAALPDLGSEARVLTAEVDAAVDAGLVEARQAVAAMRLSGEGHGTLRDLLARWLDDFEDQFGLRVEFDCDAQLPALTPRAEAEALRIAQEALANVRRHADAMVVRVRLGTDGDQLVLVVADNGRGFDPDRVGDAAYGLASMRERATLIRGELEIHSAPRQGTRVRLRVPLGTPAPLTAGAA